jgi:hypothetical protein
MSKHCSQTIANSYPRTSLASFSATSSNPAPASPDAVRGSSASEKTNERPHLLQPSLQNPIVELYSRAQLSQITTKSAYRHSISSFSPYHFQDDVPILECACPARKSLDNNSLGLPYEYHMQKQRPLKSRIHMLQSIPARIFFGSSRLSCSHRRPRLAACAALGV